MVCRTKFCSCPSILRIKAYKLETKAKKNRTFHSQVILRKLFSPSQNGVGLRLNLLRFLAEIVSHASILCHAVLKLLPRWIAGRQQQTRRPLSLRLLKKSLSESVVLKRMISTGAIRFSCPRKSLDLPLHCQAGLCWDAANPWKTKLKQGPTLVPQQTGSLGPLNLKIVPSYNCGDPTDIKPQMRFQQSDIMGKEKKILLEDPKAETNKEVLVQDSGRQKKEEILIRPTDYRRRPQLTPEMKAQIEDALRTKSNQVLVEGFHQSITRRDLETLVGLNWLNDEIINFYLNLIMERGKLEGYPTVYTFNTFFYPKLVQSGYAPLRRWTRNVDLFSYDFLLVPVHLGCHWCLAAVDLRRRKLEYYDSLGGSNPQCLLALGRYLQAESRDKKGTNWDLKSWTFYSKKNIPLQENSGDCGVFALVFAEHISRDARIDFCQSHMPYFRRRIMYEILTKKLL